MIALHILAACCPPPEHTAALPTTEAPEPLQATIEQAGYTTDDPTTFWDLDERPEVMMTHGLAGGWTLSINLLLSGLTTEQVSYVDIRAVDADGNRWFEDTQPRYMLIPLEPGEDTGWMEGVRFFDMQGWPIEELCALQGEELTLSGWVREESLGEGIPEDQMREARFSREGLTAVMDQRLDFDPCE